MAVKLERRLLSVHDYHLMSDAGILTGDDRVELLNGEIVTRSPIGSKHAGYVGKITAVLNKILDGKAIIFPQNPIKISDYSEPEPDISVLLLRDDFYISRLPEPGDIYLVIEVSDSTLEKDREVKLPLYALAGIPEVWIVNINDEQIEVHSQPREDVYTLRRLLDRSDVLTLPIEGINLPASRIWK
ncbi:MAG: Uma2 family endonuclease [Bacteroidia bacterium]|nr:Uma2 family endonuclease [Bacteroidia bacterium]